MKRKTLIITILSILLAAIAGTLVYIFVFTEKAEDEIQDEIIINEFQTNVATYFEDAIPPADTLIVGRWSNSKNPKWHKVYYDDFDEDEQLYWGKEWDEKEDVNEEDLDYHGNGWFRWEKKGDILHEYATMSLRSVPIHREYAITVSNSDSLVYNETDYNDVVYTFVKNQ